MATLTPEELSQALDLLGEKAYAAIHAEVEKEIAAIEEDLKPLYLLRDKVAPVAPPVPAEEAQPSADPFGTTTQTHDEFGNPVPQQ